MDCPRCHAPATEEILQEFGGVCPKCLLAFAAEQDAPSFPNLEIVEMIGQGGMGVVYKARQKNLNRTVALKVLSPKFSDDPEFLERFTREAQALAQLSHPNIVAIHDSGVHDRVPYLVMEYVEGRSLRVLLQSREITVAQVLDLIPQLCDALQYAHGRGVVHRDIKPENILVDAQGRVKIADYGLAKLAGAQESRLTKTGYTMGTPHYMAPEQVENSSEVDHRADIYSLGVIFYEMLTGELPLGRFKAPSEKGVRDRRLDRVVLKSLEKEPADRYQSAGEVKAQLARLDKVPPVAVIPPYSKVAVASGVLSLLTLTLFLLFLNFAGTRDLAAVAFGVMSGVSLLAGFGLSIGGIVVTFRSRGALRGGWIAVTSLVFSILAMPLGLGGLMFTPMPASHHVSSQKASNRPPPPLTPKIRDVQEVWTRSLPTTTKFLGLLAGQSRLLLVTSGGLTEIRPETGKTGYQWTGPIDNLPLFDESLVVIWGGGKLTVVQDQGNGLVQAHQIPIPCPGKIVGAHLQKSVLYATTSENAVFAYQYVFNEVLWKREGLEFLPNGTPIVTDLNVVLFGPGARRILLDRETGAVKSRDTAEGGGDRIVQWDQGWATIRPAGIHVEIATYLKRSLDSWWSGRAQNAPEFARCDLLLADRTLILTTESEMFGYNIDDLFGDPWHKILTRTRGKPAFIGNGMIAVPTDGDIEFYRALDGRVEQGSATSHMQGNMIAGAEDITGRMDWVAVLHPKTGRLSCYSVKIRKD